MLLDRFRVGPRRGIFSLVALLSLVLPLGPLSAQTPFIPRTQIKPPGPPLSPQEAIKQMKVPDGFSVELVASEPEIMNPVAMTFDERGRIWITESFEYPRKEPGKGRDRVKVLEDTDQDGKVDKVTVFAEGLNIPSGIAVGHGGVWVANSPDILFMQDTDGDLKADKTEVVVTGFGRTDTHELPNSLTWGPDGYLYGLNGVFNHSQVTHKGRDWKFTCAMFRIDPKTRDFDLFCEGTSNPWGIAWDPEGSAFVSACVIDHLWHLSETGYYLRQGGPYPPHTWHIDSIVDHKHQLAAYCGLHYFDSDAYPAEYRDRLYMGNIHGNGINVDILKRNGSTYHADGAPDFLQANDVWFMPVVQKTGPDGCLYVLDWYDRYHCYQDANADPKGIDRGHGRLYRIRYRESPRAQKFDLAAESNSQLLTRLRSENVFYRDVAQRLLTERCDEAIRKDLEKLVLDQAEPRKTRLHALWSLVGTGQLDPAFHLSLLKHSDATFRGWGVRAAGNFRTIDEPLRQQVVKLASDESADVLLQVAVASRKIEGLDPLPILVAVSVHSGSDVLIPHIVWRTLHPLLETRGKDFLAEVKKHDLAKATNLKALMPRVTEVMLGKQKKQ
jgi:putative membrane-bound dehydrogenase-like protein